MGSAPAFCMEVSRFRLSNFYVSVREMREAHFPHTYIKEQRKRSAHMDNNEGSLILSNARGDNCLWEEVGMAIAEFVILRISLIQ